MLGSFLFELACDWLVIHHSLLHCKAVVGSSGPSYCGLIKGKCMAYLFHTGLVTFWQNNKAENILTTISVMSIYVQVRLVSVFVFIGQHSIIWTIDMVDWEKRWLSLLSGYFSWIMFDSIRTLFTSLSFCLDGNGEIPCEAIYIISWEHMLSKVYIEF